MTTDFNPLRRHLEIERQGLLKELKTTTSVLSKKLEHGPYNEEEELATEIVEVEKELIFEEYLREQLAELEHALRKFDLGTYGICELCGQSIEQARLAALPQAKLCLNCMARQVKNRV